MSNNLQGQLYRAIYLRDGMPRGITFWANDILIAHESADKIEAQTKCPLLVLKPLGSSIVKTQGTNHKDTRTIRQRMMKEGIWPTGKSIVTMKRAGTAMRSQDAAELSSTLEGI